MKSIEAIEKEIIEAFDRLPDIESKYTYLFRIGEELPAMDPSLKNENTMVKGCQSKLWFYLKHVDGKLNLLVDSDSMVIKGIGALFVRLVEGRRPEDIKNLSLEFIDQLNIWKLDSNRNNGLLAMIDHLHEQAVQLSRD